VVSVGTGTSALLVEPGRVTRAGGTALGGGTIMGLGAALCGERDFDAIAALAARGDRRRVDLLIRDIYPGGDFLLPGDINAASFAKLARADQEPADTADLAHGIMGLVGENVGLICTGIAARLDLSLIAFGGSALRDNPALTAILGGLCAVLGRKPHFLAMDSSRVRSERSRWRSRGGATYGVTRVFACVSPSRSAGSVALSSSPRVIVRSARWVRAIAAR
jgi:type II pantothenate kinase